MRFQHFFCIAIDRLCDGRLAPSCAPLAPPTRSSPPGAAQPCYLENYIAAMNVAVFGGNPTPIAMVLINRKPTALSRVYEMLVDGMQIFAAVQSSGVQPESLSIGSVFHWRAPGLGVGLGYNELDFVVTTMEAWTARHPNQIYHQIPTEEVPAASSFLSCLKCYALSKGRVLQWELVSDLLFAHYKGEPSPREKLSTGAELRAAGLKLALV